ncbi:MAG: TrmH family RNA methyltransferase [Opitutae bacterium]
MNLRIESPANPRIKELVKLRESPRRRKERGVFFVEGGDDLLTLAAAGHIVEEIYVCEESGEDTPEKELRKELEKLGMETIATSSIAHAKASYRSAKHGIIGVVRSWELDLKEYAIINQGPVVVLDEVEKPGNVGAILRSVEAFGGAGVILSDPTVDFFNPNVVRSSRGLMGRIPVAVGSKEEVLDWLQKSGRKIIATSSRAEKQIDQATFSSPTALVFGSEKVGLGEYWHEQEIEWIKIPMKGKASSLNLNVSVSCMLYESNRLTG